MFYKRYVDIYKKYNPIIIFLDTKPRVSWRRRKPYYLERIKKSGITDVKEKQKMLKKYRQTIDDLYPLWLKWYKKFPFEKYMIKNSYKSYKKFVDEVFDTFSSISSSFHFVFKKN